MTKKLTYSPLTSRTLTLRKPLGSHKQSNDYKGRIYTLKGTPFEIGYAMGQSLGARLEVNIERYVQARVSLGDTLNVAAWRSGALPWLRALPARFLEEFEGLAQGAKLPLPRLAEWAYLEVLLAGGCSGAIITWPTSGQTAPHAWVARNNDIFAPGMWGYVTIREIPGRIPSISFGLEGDVFTPTGINQDKLWLHYNYLPAWDTPLTDRPHLPAYAFMVEALETCRTLQELEALLRRIQRDDGMLLFAVEGKTNAYALYECGCTDFYKREPTQGWLVGTNHYCIHPQAPPPRSAGPRSTVSRYKQMGSLIEARVSQGGDAPPVKALIQILADPAIEAREGDIVTTYANVACPSTGELWYTFGGYPAASCGNWQKLAWPW